jgi:hypothetical protein
MNPVELLDHCNLILGRVEKLWKIALSIMIAAGGGVLWGARLEWRVTEAAASLVEVKTKADSTALDVSRIKGHMNISKTPPPASTLQTASIPPCTDPNPEQQTH